MEKESKLSVKVEVKTKTKVKDFIEILKKFNPEAYVFMEDKKFEEPLSTKTRTTTTKVDKIEEDFLADAKDFTLHPVVIIKKV